MSTSVRTPPFYMHYNLFQRHYQPWSCSIVNKRLCWVLMACFDPLFQMEEQIRSWMMSARPSDCWGWVWANWRTTSTTWNLWPSTIKHRSSLLAKTMSCSFPSPEPEMQRKGRIIFQITCHPWSPYKKVSTYDWFMLISECVCCQCLPQVDGCIFDEPYVCN